MDMIHRTIGPFDPSLQVMFTLFTALNCWRMAGHIGWPAIWAACFCVFSGSDQRVPFISLFISSPLDLPHDWSGRRKTWFAKRLVSSNERFRAVRWRHGWRRRRRNWTWPSVRRRRRVSSGTRSEAARDERAFCEGQGIEIDGG